MATKDGTKVREVKKPTLNSPTQKGFVQEGSTQGLGIVIWKFYTRATETEEEGKPVKYVILCSLSALSQMNDTQELQTPGKIHPGHLM